MFDRVRYQRLLPRGKPGLACDDDGLAIGPVPLIVRQRTAKGDWQYQPLPRDIIDRAMTTAYGVGFATYRSWFYSSLTGIAEKM